MIAPGFTRTQWKPPRTGETPLRVQWRNGQVSRWTFKASQLRWTDEGHPYDIIAVRKASKGD